MMREAGQSLCRLMLTLLRFPLSSPGTNNVSIGGSLIMAVVLLRIDSSYQYY